LIDGSWDLESFQEDGFLSLKTNVFWPFDKSSEISLMLNISSNTKISGSLLEDWSLVVRDSFFFTVFFGLVTPPLTAGAFLVAGAFAFAAVVAGLAATGFAAGFAAGLAAGLVAAGLAAGAADFLPVED